MRDAYGLENCPPEARAIYYAQMLAFCIARGDTEEIKRIKGELDRACEAAIA